MYQAKEKMWTHLNSYLTHASLLAYMRANMRLKQGVIFSAVEIHEYLMENARRTVDENDALHRRVAELESKLAAIQGDSLEELSADHESDANYDFDPDNPDPDIEEYQNDGAEIDVEQSICEQSEEASICDDLESQEYGN